MSLPNQLRLPYYSYPKVIRQFGNVHNPLIMPEQNKIELILKLSENDLNIIKHESFFQIKYVFANNRI